jgi:UDP-N-acetylmuramoyl-tripeptide--D-alanyl-D-alanine ligase
VAGVPSATRVTHVADAQEAAAALSALLVPGDVVLVKGPRAAGLERVAATLVGDDRR